MSESKPAVTPLKPVVLTDTLMDGAMSVSLAGGLAMVFSSRSPTKETSNEDAAAVIPLTNTSAVLMVADGVGGLRSGERASEVAVHRIMQSVKEAPADIGQLRSSVLNGVEAANREVCKLAPGAGTTLALLELVEGAVRPYHAGDSFILVVGQRGKVKLETVSHSPTGYAVEAGFLDEKAALFHEERHIITNMLGTPDLRIELGSRLVLRPRDTVLVGSDGLSDNLQTKEIIDIIRKGPLKKAANRLITRARARMASGETRRSPSKPDDLTFILFRPSA